MKNYLKYFMVGAFAFSIASCTAIYTRMSKSDMQVKVEMSDTIWLDPVAPEQQTIYVQIRNTSGSPYFGDFNKYIKAEFTNKGYSVVNDPNKAHYLMQVNIKTANLVLETSDGQVSGVPGAILGGVVGSQVGGGKGNELATTAGAVVGGLATMYLDAKTKDGYYNVVVDIKLQEKTDDVVKSKEYQVQAQGNSGERITTSSGTSNRKSYTTILTATSNKVNLTEEEGAAVMQERIASSLAGLF